MPRPRFGFALLCAKFATTAARRPRQSDNQAAVSPLCVGREPGLVPQSFKCSLPRQGNTPPYFRYFCEALAHRALLVICMQSEWGEERIEDSDDAMSLLACLLLTLPRAIALCTNGKVGKVHGVTLCCDPRCSVCATRGCISANYKAIGGGRAAVADACCLMNQSRVCHDERDTRCKANAAEAAAERPRRKSPQQRPSLPSDAHALSLHLYELKQDVRRAFPRFEEATLGLIASSDLLSVSTWATAQLPPTRGDSGRRGGGGKAAAADGRNGRHTNTPHADRLPMALPAVLPFQLDETCGNGYLESVQNRAEPNGVWCCPKHCGPPGTVCACSRSLALRSHHVACFLDSRPSSPSRESTRCNPQCGACSAHMYKRASDFHQCCPKLLVQRKQTRRGCVDAEDVGCLVGIDWGTGQLGASFWARREFWMRYWDMYAPDRATIGRG